MSSRTRKAASPPPYDVTQPPQGVRLRLGTVAKNLGVSTQDMAQAAGISKTAVFDLMAENRWPVRTSQEAIRTALRTLFVERGATDDDVERLFWAHGPHTHVAQPAAPRATSPTPIAEEHEMLLPKTALTPQARAHFKLFRNPFDGEVMSDASMFRSDDVVYVREAAWHCAQNGGFVAIVGESGAGKTTIQADLEARLEQHSDQAVIVVKPSVLGMEENNHKGQMLKSTDILSAIISTLDPNTTMPQTLQARTVKANKLLAASFQTGNSHLLVIEEAHGLPDSTLKHLKRLNEMRHGRRALIGVLLLAQPELKVRLSAGLRSGLLREVAQRCEIVELLPLDNDLAAYLQCRAAAQQVDLSRLLDTGAIDQLRVKLTRKTSGGVVSMCYPLAVNNMVTRCLNAAAELGVPLVTKDVVASV
jgi:type II secretory pathway predicted ATPase ExeA